MNEGYPNLLLTGLAWDYVSILRRRLIGVRLMKRIMSVKPNGTYPKFSKKDAYLITDNTMAKGGTPRQILKGGTEAPYATLPRGLSEFIDYEDLQFKEGPFLTYEKNGVIRLMFQSEMNEEIRIAKLFKKGTRKKILTTLNNWKSKDGNPYADIKEAIVNVFLGVNQVVIPKPVWSILENHPVLIAKLGEANLVKVLSVETFKKLFNIPEATIDIVETEISTEKENASEEFTLVNIWGNNMYFAHTSDVENEPCFGIVIMVKYPEADNTGYIVRVVPSKCGVKGGEELIVTGRTVELIVCEECGYTLENCI